jgi:2'-5' RNA ligase
MSQELLFLDIESRKSGHNLFVAILTPEYLHQRLVATATRLSARYVLAGKVRPLQNLHITLCDFQNSRGSLASDISIAKRACEAAARSAAPFGIVMDCVRSFRGKDKNPLVLQPRIFPEGLAKVRNLLQTEFVKQRSKPHFSSGKSPHVTLLYDRQSVPEESIAPLGWIAEEIVLVQSHVGESRYTIHGRWSLQG